MEQTQSIDVESIQNEVAEKGRELLEKAAVFAREQPHLAVAAAFGIGWILGNGLSPRIVTAGARLGMRTLLGGALAGSGLVGVLGGEEGEFPGFARRSQGREANDRDREGEPRSGADRGRIKDDG
jgi:hypothetical protein